LTPPPTKRSNAAVVVEEEETLTLAFELELKMVEPVEQELRLQKRNPGKSQFLLRRQEFPTEAEGPDLGQMW
jgi:hypothetical protein